MEKKTANTPTNTKSASALLQRYLWLYNLLSIYSLSQNDIRKEWVKSGLSKNLGLEDKKIHRNTFINHCKVVEEIFDCDIQYNRDKNTYHIDKEERNPDLEPILETLRIKQILQNSTNIRNHIFYENIPSGEKYLVSLLDAIDSNLKIELDYHKFTSTTSKSYILRPYAVKLLKKRWYLIAANDEHPERESAYGLDRIEKIEITNEKFDAINVEDVMKKYINIFGVITSDDKIQHIIIKAKGKFKPNYIKSLPLHHSQKQIEKGPDYAIFEYYLIPTFDFIQEILSHREEIEILEPESFRQEIISVLEKTLKNYK